MSEFAEAAQKGGRNMALFGVITMVLGLLAMGAPMLTGFSVLTLVGLLMVGGGVIRMLWAFKAESLGGGMLVFALGGLTLFFGLALLANPLYGAGLVTMILTIYLVVDGISEVMAAFGMKPAQGWGWMLFGGILSILLGVMIFRQYPLSGPMAIGIILGVKLFMSGLMMLTIGGTVRGVAKSV